MAKLDWLKPVDLLKILFKIEIIRVVGNLRALKDSRYHDQAASRLIEITVVRDALSGRQEA